MNVLRQSLFPTLTKNYCCVFVDRKNYRLQDIQLSKISRGKYRPRQTFGGRGRFPPEPPSLAHSWGPYAPLRFARG